MGKLRLFTRSVVFTGRTRKRFIVFLLIFALSAAFIAFFVDQLDSYQTSDYLDQRGVYLKQRGDFEVTYNQSTHLADAIKATNFGFELDQIIQYRYIDLDSSLRMYLLNFQYPWANPDVNPDKVSSGDYPHSKYDILIPDRDRQIRASNNNVTVESSVAVGSHLDFISNNHQISLNIAGHFDTGAFSGVNDDQMWIFVSDTAFDEILDLYHYNSTSVYTYSMSVTAKITPIPGIAPFIEIPSETDYEHVQTMKLKLESDEYLGDEINYGIWQKVADTSSTKTKIANRGADLTSLGYAIFGGIMLVIFFSYLLSRFRRREIAVLKAMGYSKSDIRTTLMGEIFTISTIGFVIGVGSAQFLLLQSSAYARSALLTRTSLGVSFVIIVIVTLAGMIVATAGALRVSPMEIFRDK